MPPIFLPAIPPNPQSKPWSKGQVITLPNYLIPNSKPTKSFTSWSLNKTCFQTKGGDSLAHREERQHAAPASLPNIPTDVNGKNYQREFSSLSSTSLIRDEKPTTKIQSICSP